ncbi:OmpP1/FadL family transporter [Chitinivorax sp. PXF-14]|uniref:OmpP1/FadL family transporter n=1 Tax=Chitinivorax sp. PXF-14 TaxID=3230488 RepID=UPI0034666750
MKRNAISLSIMMIGLALAGSNAMASGYHFGTQSAAAQGTANANGAEAADASTIFSNPAGLSHLQGSNVSGVLDLVAPDVSYHDEGSYVSTPSLSNALPTVFGTPRPTGGGDGGKFAKPIAVPHFYYARQFDDKLSFGMGAFVPFGSKTKYDDNWAGRYNIVNTELTTVAFNPSFAFRLNPTVTIGGGVSAQYIDGKLARKVNYGAVLSGALLKAAPTIASQVGSAAAAQVIAAGGSAAQAQAAGAAAATSVTTDIVSKASAAYANPTYDGDIDVKGDDWGYGFNLGVMFDIDRDTRLGFAYRSKVKHQLKGTADWSTPASVANYVYTVPVAGTAVPIGAAAAQAIAASTALGGLGHVDSDASLNVTTPESLSVSFFKQMTEQWAIMADYTRTRHSRLQELRIDFDSTTPDSITSERWMDTNKVSVGANFKLNDAWLLRAGLAYDNSPVNEDNRTPSIPDGDRTWYSVGANWKLNKQMSVDFAYSYVKVNAGSIHNTDNNNGQYPADPACNCSNATVVGKYDIRANIVGVQMNYAF